MSQQLPDDLSRADLAVYGEAVVNRGLEVRGAIDGVGLLTHGLVWHCPQIWTQTGVISSISTSWTAYGSTLTSTTWTTPQNGIWGEC